MTAFLRKLFTGFGIVYKRLSVQPFEAALALLTILSGILLLVRVGPPRTPSPVTALLPEPLVFAFRMFYFASGVGMFAGLGWGYRNLEAFGLILLLTSLGGFTLTMLVVIGFKPLILGSVIGAVVFGIAAVMRLMALLRGRFLLEIESVDLDVPS